MYVEKTDTMHVCVHSHSLIKMKLLLTQSYVKQQHQYVSIYSIATSEILYQKFEVRISATLYVLVQTHNKLWTQSYNPAQCLQSVHLGRTLLWLPPNPTLNRMSHSVKGSAVQELGWEPKGGWPAHYPILSSFAKQELHGT